MIIDRKTLGNAVLTTYVLENSEEIESGRKRPLVLIIPGGGYTHVSAREGEPVAVRFLSYGFNASVLTYSVSPVRFPAQVEEAAGALSYIRENSGRFNTSSEKIALLGFSAGAHLAASLCCLGNEMGAQLPDALVLGYPVILYGEKGHISSFVNLTGGDEGLMEKLSLEKRVPDTMPPVFLFHAEDDPAVPVENTILFADALERKGIPHEVRLYKEGGHGFSLSNGEVATSRSPQRGGEAALWSESVRVWLEKLFDVSYYT